MQDRTITFYLAIFTLIILPFSVAAQVYFNNHILDPAGNGDTASVFLGKIEIVGNKATKAVIIHRELLFSEKQKVTFSQISAAQKRLASLELFTQVRFDIVGDEKYSTLIITVYERWYVYAAPIFYTNERSWKKLSYGAQGRYYNFLGRNITLKLTAAFGYNPEFRFQYENPWFFGNWRLFTQFKAYKGKVQAKNFELDQLEYKSRGIDWLVGKRFGHFLFFGLNLSYQQIKTDSGSKLTVSPSGKDNKITFISSVQYDNRDWKEYPHRGWNINFWGKRVSVNHSHSYYRFGGDVRTYMPVTKKTTLALRAASSFKAGDVPLYDRVFFGYDERIRGRFNQIVEGEQLLFGGAEFRFPILPIRYIALPSVEQLEYYSSHLKFGISGALFVETGAVWYENQALTADIFRSGFGAGIHFHLPYVNLLRVELGLNSTWKAEAIIEVEAAF
ncbi:MAG: BamA/TamA family outer membrane protein [Calditrichaeota bacterium]|nr:BamA/TamA family outer membrane protein [Calditrichota bacterium]